MCVTASYWRYKARSHCGNRWATLYANTSEMLLRKPCHTAPTATVEKHFDARQRAPTATVEQHVVTLREPASDNTSRALAAVRPSKSIVNRDRLHFKDQMCSLPGKKEKENGPEAEAGHGNTECSRYAARWNAKLCFCERVGLTYDVRNFTVAGSSPHRGYAQCARLAPE